MDHYQAQAELKRMGIGHIDFLILQTIDSYQMGGLSYVIDKVSIGTAIVSGIDPTYLKKGSRTDLERLSDKAEEVVHVYPGSYAFSYEFGKTVITVFPPEKAEYEDDLYEYSFAVKFECGDTAVLFMGDMSNSNSAALIESESNISADVIVPCPYPDQEYIAKELAKASGAEYAVMLNLNYNNKKYDFDTYGVFECQGIKVLYTVDGAALESDSVRINIRTD